MNKNSKLRTSLIENDEPMNGPADERRRHARGRIGVGRSKSPRSNVRMPKNKPK